MDGRPLSATIKTIAPNQSALGTNLVTAKMDLSIDRLGNVLGRTVRIRFITPSSEQGVWVPTTALSQGSRGQWSVLVASQEADESVRLVTDSQASTFIVQSTPVTILRMVDNWALVDSGLESGQKVVVDGRHRVVPGQEVKPVDVSETYPAPSIDSTGASE